MAKKVTLADGSVVDAPDHPTYWDAEARVWRQDYDLTTPREFVNMQNQIIELKRQIQLLERQQLQFTLMFNHAGRAALDPELQDLRQQLQVLEGGA